MKLLYVLKERAPTFMELAWRSPAYENVRSPERVSHDAAWGSFLHSTFAKRRRASMEEARGWAGWPPLRSFATGKGGEASKNRQICGSKARKW